MSSPVPALLVLRRVPDDRRDLGPTQAAHCAQATFAGDKFPLSVAMGANDHRLQQATGLNRRFQLCELRLCKCSAGLEPIGQDIGDTHLPQIRFCRSIALSRGGYGVTLLLGSGDECFEPSAKPARGVGAHADAS